MKKNLRSLAGAAVGVVASLLFTSCYYDPAYSSATVGGSYSSGYGDGYGYGGSGFSTSVFVSTGNPQWGYDPNCYSYYDYHRHCYYDPYLNGYYPVGYRPPVVYGVPHPYGWHRGGGYIRPPVHVTNVTVKNYHNRETLYRKTNYDWARQVRQQPASQSHGGRSNSVTRSSSNSNSRNSQSTRTSSYQTTRQNTNPGARSQSNGLPSRYNTPVKASDHQKARQQSQTYGGNRQQAQRNAQTQAQRNKQPAQRTEQGKNHNSKKQDEEIRRESRYR